MPGEWAGVPCSGWLPVLSMLHVPPVALTQVVTQLLCKRFCNLQTPLPHLRPPLPPTELMQPRRHLRCERCHPLRCVRQVLLPRR
jgi:hypothetical protein